MFYGVETNIQLRRSLWRELVLFRADYACEQCSLVVGQEPLARSSSGKLHAHHIDKNDQNNCIDNGIALCASCHSKLHTKGVDMGARFKGAGGGTSESVKKAWETRRRTTSKETDQTIMSSNQNNTSEKASAFSSKDGDC